MEAIKPAEMAQRVQRPHPRSYTICTSNMSYTEITNATTLAEQILRTASFLLGFTRKRDIYLD